MIPKKPISSFLIYLCVLLFSACEKNDAAIGDDLRQRAIQELDTVMVKQERWVKVHAAEYKIELGYTEDVAETFMAELLQAQNQSQYRIGVWRVLAQCNSLEVDQYREKIAAAFRDKQGDDRVYAAESMAKLGLNLKRWAPEATEEVLNGPVNSLYVYTMWSSLQGEDPADEVSALLELVKNKKLDDLLVMQAAYALRNEGNLSITQWKNLASQALAREESSAAKVYLLSAAFIHAPESEKGRDTFAAVREQLLLYRDSAEKGAQMELAIALGRAGRPEDLAVLKKLLEGSNPVDPSGDPEAIALHHAAQADIRATAAYSILTMDRRREYSLALGDWLVVVLYLAGMLGVGYYFSRKNKNERDYYLGGGKMNPIAVGLSLFATLLSSLSYLSYPGEMVKYGPVILSGILVFPLVYYVVGWFLIPQFMKLRVTSAYQILEINLGVSIRLLATFFFLSLRFLWMGTIIFITVHTAILAIFGFDQKYALLISILLMGITIFYTTMGGLKAVVFTDVIQSGVLMGGAILTLLVVSYQLGSFTSWIPGEWLTQWGELKIGLDARERLTIANALLTTFVWYVASSGSDQMSIQRFLATENVQTARKTFGVSLITNFVVQCLLGLVGLAVLAYFLAFPQYLSPGETVSSHADQLFPKFILVGLPVGISGLVAAGILAAAMSSLSSGLNSTSSVISEDLIKRFTKNYKAPKNQMRGVRNLSFFVGIFALVLSVLISKVEGNLYDVIVRVVNLFVSPLFVLFFMALFVPFATARATLAGGLISVATAIAISFFKWMGIEVLFILPASLLAGILSGSILSYLDYRLLGNRETMEKRSREAAIFKDPGEVE
ncbi:transporter, SSS family [Cyclobacterium lianum]|uniref:Transporter, SSS family n=1 Tax=Cyclobacterium lianum TaxID=388280 RepID=A0A1M7PC01_9BACT|nr:sodium:solute symporter [Cyclobacterium lianum]SHN14414.1 transporter, SSS family [Cyclobacterium lianum]